jgi:hypothetical protein
MIMNTELSNLKRPAQVVVYVVTFALATLAVLSAIAAVVIEFAIAAQ